LVRFVRRERGSREVGRKSKGGGEKGEKKGEKGEKGERGERGKGEEGKEEGGREIPSLWQQQ
jgi:hypothetical protein